MTVSELVRGQKVLSRRIYNQPYSFAGFPLKILVRACSSGAAANRKLSRSPSLGVGTLMLGCGQLLPQMT
jgi:hypothetical protein